MNVNACLILLQRAGGVDEWAGWAQSLPRKGEYWIPEKMLLAIQMWDDGIRAFEFDKIRALSSTAHWAVERGSDG